MRRLILSVVLVLVMAPMAIAAVPVLTAGRDSTGIQGERFWWKFINTSDNGTAGKATMSLGINWGDGHVQLLSTPTDTTALHYYAQPGAYTISMTGVNADGTGKGHTHVTITSGRLRKFGAVGKMVIAGPLRTVTNQVTLTSTSAFRFRLFYGGIGDETTQPVAAGVPWTIPADWDSMAIAALTDSVFARVW